MAHKDDQAGLPDVGHEKGLAGHDTTSTGDEGDHAIVKDWDDKEEAAVIRK